MSAEADGKRCRRAGVEQVRRVDPPKMPAPTSGDAEDDGAHLAWGEADGGHAATAGEAQRLALGARVADHEGRHERRRREPGAEIETGCVAADDDAEVDDTLTPAVEGAVHEGAELARPVPVARATAPSNMSKAAPTVATMPASSHHSTAANTPPNAAMPKPISVSMLGVSPARDMARASGSIAGARMPRALAAGEMDGRLAIDAIPTQERCSCRVEAQQRTRGSALQMTSRPDRRVSTRPAARSRRRCHETSGWLTGRRAS